MKRGVAGRPVLAVTILMVLFVATVAVSDIAGAVLFKLAVYAISIFLVMPALLRLPTGRTTVLSFPKDVGLARVSPIGGNLLLLFIVYATFAASQLAGQWIHRMAFDGPFVVDLGRNDLFSSDAPVSTILEEIVMRGVMLTYLLTRLSRGRAVLLSSAVFAGIHILNLLNPESDPLFVLAQVVWAFAIGVMYAEIFIRTRSLYLPILIHFLVNGTVDVWFHGLDGRSLASAMLGIPFYGVIPALLGICWLRLLRREA